MAKRKRRTTTKDAIEILYCEFIANDREMRVLVEAARADAVIGLTKPRPAALPAIPFENAADFRLPGK